MSWGKGAKLLLFVFCFTMLFSVAELGAGIVSKSLLLVEESVHMFADSISFGISLWAETRIASDPTRSQKANLFGTGISLLTLTFTMCAVFFESIRRLVNFKDHGVVVNSSIMLVFGIILCCFHAMCLFMYFAGFSVHSGHGHSHDGGDHGKKQAKVDCEEDSEDESEKQDKCCGSDVELASSHGHSNCDHSHSHGHGHGHGHAHAHGHDHQPIHNHDHEHNHEHNHRHDHHHHANEPKEDQDFQEIDLSVIQPLQDEDDHDHDHDHDHHCDHGHEHSHECSHGHSHSCCGFDHTSLNMASAVFHIFIDFLHSFFVVVTALILRVLDRESSLTGTVDAIASLLLTLVIGGGVFVIGRELFDQIAKFRGYSDVASEPMSKESASPIELANETIGNPNDASEIRVVATA